VGFFFNSVNNSALVYLLVGLCNIFLKGIDILMLQMKYIRPDSRLHGLITSYYLMTTANGTSVEIDDYLLPEWSNLRCQLQGSVIVHQKNGAAPVFLSAPSAKPLLFGATFSARRIELSGVIRIAGAGIFPRGWQQLFGGSADSWTERIGPPSEIWDHDPTDGWQSLSMAKTEGEIQAAFDKIFLDQLARKPRPQRSIVTEAVEQLLVDANTNSVEEVAKIVGISLRQMERLSYQIFGHSPKQVIRKFRFLRTIAAMPQGMLEGWDEAIDRHYYDQSHFIRDFKQFTGVTPSQFLKSPPILMYGYMRSIGKAISLKTIPSAFHIFGAGGPEIDTATKSA
jgi:AraC-like DNA-binding protein